MIGGIVEEGEAPWDVVVREVETTEEADNIRYFKFQNIPKNTSPNQAERIKDYIKDPIGIVYRPQAGISSIELLKQGKL